MSNELCKLCFPWTRYYNFFNNKNEVMDSLLPIRSYVSNGFSITFSMPCHCDRILCTLKLILWTCSPSIRNKNTISKKYEFRTPYKLPIFRCSPNLVISLPPFCNSHKSWSLLFYWTFSWKSIPSFLPHRIIINNWKAKIYNKIYENGINFDWRT